MFVDEARVFVAGGRGGNGAAHFHREKYRPKGGPDGGNGGRGGSVTFVADHSVGSLVWLKDHTHQKAVSGGPGGPNNRTGADAEDLIARVPVGTTIRSDDGELVADLAASGDSFVVARGGRGGRGNASFLSDARRAPGFSELGEPAEKRWIRLELRIVADVAVIGFPNSGKSTLVSALSAARPKIADYPFTTLEPHVGMVERGQHRFAVCDIPGLIEGAHKGRGLGTKFLRHAVRALAFVHLIDLESGRDPLDDYLTVRNELLSFDATLSDRVEVVCLNKTDAVSTDATDAVAVRFQAKGIEAVPISAKEGSGLDGLVDQLVEVVSLRRAQTASVGFELFKTPSKRVTVSREGSAWRVKGEAVERWVAMTDLQNPEAVSYFQDRMERTGVERALGDAGATPGDEVRIGNESFEWQPSQTEPTRGRRNRKR